MRCVSMPLESLESRRLFAVTLTIDYSLDTSGFFNVAERKTAMAQAASLISAQLSDTLAAVVPSGGNSVDLVINNPSGAGQTTLPNASIPADTIRIYVGGTAFGGSQLGLGGAAGYQALGDQAWFDLLSHRPSQDSSNTVLEAPLAGSIAFDTTANWHFGLTTSGLADNENDFLSVAQHELMHVLGITSSAPQFAARTSAGKFVGTKAMALFGGPVPLASDLSHLKEGTISPGEGEAVMDPSLITGTRKLLTKLDLALLDDIGWTLVEDGGPSEDPTPTAIITGGSNLAVAEGVTVTYSGSTSTVSAGSITTYEWDTDYDGTSFTADVTGEQLAFTAPDGPKTRTIALRVTTAAGKSGIATQTLMLGNTAPTATFSFNATSAAFTNVVDVEADLSSLTYTFDLNNDGISEQKGASATFTLPTSAIQNDTRVLKGTVTDKDGGKSDYTVTVTLPFDSTSPPPPPASPFVMTPDPSKKGKFTVVINGTSGNDELRIGAGPSKNKPTLIFNNLTMANPISALTRVVVLLGDGNDSVNVASAKIPFLIDGAAGNDTIVTGGGKDVLIGGLGSDTLRGGSGEDLLVPGRPSEALSAGAGNTILTMWLAKGKLAARVSMLTVFSSTNIADTETDTLDGEKSNDAYLLFSSGDSLPTRGKQEVAIAL